MKAQVLLLALVAAMGATSIPTQTQADSEITRGSCCSSCGCKSSCSSCSGCSTCNTCSCSTCC